jgi:hypothetical protein
MSEIEPFKRTSKNPRPPSQSEPEPSVRYFVLDALRNPILRKRIATAMWAERMQKQGWQSQAQNKDRIAKAVEEILDNAIIYLEDS